MDLVSTVKNVRDVNWDLPFRLVASLIAIAAFAGVWSGEAALGNLASAARSLQWSAAARWLLDADSWARDTLSPACWAFALVLIIALLVNVTNSTVIAESRAPSTAWLAVAALAYCSPFPLWWWFPASTVGVVIRLAVRGKPLKLNDAWEWSGMTIINLLVAGVWLPVSALLWATTPARLSGKRS
ncbi:MULTISPECIES: hypothetical protein [unclassified Microbacterium]|uniref:hypothetical protein n=1 Tax=unclassified Microbacterium TaxID=2609290 RepID=UPI0011B09C5A|nr:MULTISPECIES: hypothetical protein [unclassified Microbacterium]